MLNQTTENVTKPEKQVIAEQGTILTRKEKLPGHSVNRNWGGEKRGEKAPQGNSQGARDVELINDQQRKVEKRTCHCLGKREKQMLTGHGKKKIKTGGGVDEYHQ